MPGNTSRAQQTFAYDGLRIGCCIQRGRCARFGKPPGVLDWTNSCRGATQRQDPITFLVDNRQSIVGAWEIGTSRLAQSAEYQRGGAHSTARPGGNCTVHRDWLVAVLNIPAGMPFGFTAAWRSRVTGLVFMRSRWYSTELGQFVSPDPIAPFTDRYNAYRYAGGDPINPVQIRWGWIGRDSRRVSLHGTPRWTAGRAKSGAPSRMRPHLKNPDKTGASILATAAATVSSFAGHAVAAVPDALIGLSEIPWDLHRVVQV